MKVRTFSKYLPPRFRNNKPKLEERVFVQLLSEDEWFEKAINMVRKKYRHLKLPFPLNRRFEEDREFYSYLSERIPEQESQKLWKEAESIESKYHLGNGWQEAFFVYIIFDILPLEKWEVPPVIMMTGEQYIALHFYSYHLYGSGNLEQLLEGGISLEQHYKKVISRPRLKKQAIIAITSKCSKQNLKDWIDRNWESVQVEAAMRHLPRRRPTRRPMQLNLFQDIARLRDEEKKTFQEITKELDPDGRSLDQDKVKQYFHRYKRLLKEWKAGNV